jgi:predicted alpha/beta-fold hydrolase
VGSSQIPNLQDRRAEAGSHRDTRQDAGATPSFRPRRWFAGGHVQTIASFLLPRRIPLPQAEERQVEVAPSVRVRCWCYWQQERTQPMTLLVVHGLEGSSESNYMMGVARNGLAAGMNVVLMNQRNCGGMNHCAPVLYNSSLSADVAAVAQQILEHDRISRFALIGFSMGGNLVLKCAGEWGHQGPQEFKAVAAVCPAMDLAASADALHEPANRIYEWYFLWQLFRRIRAKAKFFPGYFDLSRLRGVTSLRLFDDRITAHYCGFTGADDYYARAAAANVVDRIARPTLILHAANDPFIRVLPQTLAKIRSNPNITYIETPDGGHCAFIANPDGNGYDGHWAEREVVEFARRS